MRSPPRSLGLLLTALLALAAPIEGAPAQPATADARFAALGARFIAEFGRYSPVNATGLGDHRFDDDLDDMSAAVQEH